MRAFLLATSVLATAGLATAPASSQNAPPTSAKITQPRTVLKEEPGSDYFLANATQTEQWLKTIAAESDRTKLVNIGKTAEGRDQYMLIVSSPDNIRNLEKYRQISQRLALAKGLTDDQAKALAAEGKAVILIDAGLHASEVANVQAQIQSIHGMITGNDPETLRLLGDVVTLFVFANPDGHELVANWYMRNPDIKKRRTDDVPVLYQKYIGHDNNRDSFVSNQPETTNMNRVAYREWYPQILYNRHQTGPVGTIVFIPPFRDPYNFNNEPLVINQTDMVGGAMHARLTAKGMGGTVSRNGAPYSTWFNGGIRTIGYFHNQIGILTEIIGNPTPMEVPLVPNKQIAGVDALMPIAPQKWHFQQTLDYIKEMDRAVLDYGSRFRETVLYNRYVMGRNQIRKGSDDSWIVTPGRVDAVKAAAAAMETKRGGSALDELVGYDSRQIAPSSLYKTVLQDKAARAPRAYVLPADAQPDMPTTVKFLNSLIKAGVEVERAPAAFSFAGKRYPAGSFVVRADQAFRPHVLDMFEPQDHPQDFAYPGGPPVRPYDITGYTLAFQMNVKFDRLLDDAPAHFPLVADVMDTPPLGSVIGSGTAGYVVSHATNNSFTLTNRLMKARVPVFWMKSPVTVGGTTMAPGALWIPASGQSKSIVQASVGPLGIDAHAVDAKPAGDTIAVKPVRIGLADVYGGSMASGHTRWILEQYEFPYTKVFPQELDRGNLNRKYDVLVLQTDVMGREGRSPQPQPAALDIPAQFRSSLGRISTEKTVPQLTAFTRAGGTLITVGNAGALATQMGLPITNALTTVGPGGKRVPMPGSTFYVPGSVLSAKVDVTNPLAYGVPETVDVFYNNNPTYTMAPGAGGMSRVSWFASDNPLRSGWAWGQKALNDTAAVIDAPMGRGRVVVLAPEVTQRGQAYGTFKFLFNGIYFGPSQAGAATAARADATKRADD